MSKKQLIIVVPADYNLQYQYSFHVVSHRAPWAGLTHQWISRLPFRKFAVVFIGICYFLSYIFQTWCDIFRELMRLTTDQLVGINQRLSNGLPSVSPVMKKQSLWWSYSFRWHVMYHYYQTFMLSIYRIYRKSHQSWWPGGRLNKKDGLTRYGNSHVKDKTS